MRTSILLLFVLLGSFAQAEAKNSCDFKLQCEVDQKKFRIEMKSVSGHCDEDDMEAIFESNGVKQTLALEKDWYSYTQHVSNTQPSVCKGEDQIGSFAAYQLDKNHVVMFIKSSGRPHHDRVNAVVLDVDRGTVLDSKLLGTSRNNYIGVLKHKNGFRLRLIRDSLSLYKLVDCDCDAAIVDDWMKVSVAKGKIKTDWKN